MPVLSKSAIKNDAGNTPMKIYFMKFSRRRKSCLKNVPNISPNNQDCRQSDSGKNYREASLVRTNSRWLWRPSDIRGSRPWAHLSRPACMGLAGGVIAILRHRISTNRHPPSAIPIPFLSRWHQPFCPFCFRPAMNPTTARPASIRA